jgi:hypothetical protein
MYHKLHFILEKEEAFLRNQGFEFQVRLGSRMATSATVPTDAPTTTTGDTF